MPELPEVETTIRELRKKVLKRTFINIWTDFPKHIKKPKNFQQFKKKLRNKKIRKVWRRGKNIIFDLSENKTLLIHQKLTGHLLFGIWEFKRGIWKPKLKKSPLRDPKNRFIHLIFFLDNGKMLALSDLRKFAKIELWDSKDLKESKEFKSLGPEPLAQDFTFKKFKECLKNKKGKIKQVLMDQTVVAGIGNIYSDEILFASQIHPFTRVFQLKEKNLKKIYQEMKIILKKAIELKGESFSDYRTPTGEKGNFDKIRKVYRKEGAKCFRCGAIIKRIKIGGRSAHFCPQCQQ